ncbi:MAG: hypothetical protein IKO93_10500 [Lentisphaeria bacterium]|nr:hypothetical protein [Lentisphaeria bacterium]
MFPVFAEKQNAIWKTLSKQRNNISSSGRFAIALFEKKTVRCETWQSVSAIYGPDGLDRPHGQNAEDGLHRNNTGKHEISP